MTENLTYAGAGVDYGTLDRFKVLAQRAAAETSSNIRRLNEGEFEVLESSRGESCFLIGASKSFLGHVEEGLGTKSLVADAMYKLTGKSYYDHIAQCTVAMIVNDMITVGALPQSVAMHLAVGDSDWFLDEQRYTDLIQGWKKACNLARCAWGGGETPALKGIIMPDTALLSGSAVGFVKPKSNQIDPKNIRSGDSIVFVASSGIHANGLTLARKIAESLPKGYLTEVEDGRTYGELLLEPTHIYVGLVEECQNANIPIHYAVNVTGHGWRKLMRAPQPFTYVIDRLPVLHPIFEFIQKYGPVDDREAYGNFNMGAGFALYTPLGYFNDVVDIAKRLGLSAWRAGHVEESTEKKVVIRPKNIEFAEETLKVR